MLCNKDGAAPVEANLTVVTLVLDAIFMVLSFLAFMLAAIYIGVPQKFVYQGREVFFTMETLYMTIDAR